MAQLSSPAPSLANLRKEELKEWKNIFNEIGSKILKPSGEREPSKSSNIYSLSLKSLEGSFKKLKDLNKPQIQLRASLFDATYKRFFGSTWKGPYKSVKTLKYDETIYFQTSLNDSNILVIVELVAKLSDDKHLSCGWSFLRPFGSDENKRSNERVGWYGGTPRALFFMDTIENKIEQLTGCYLNYSFSDIQANDSFKSRLPENIFVSEINTVKDKSSALIDQLFITLNPNITSFESQLCTSVANDYYLWENAQIDPSGIEIAERRLKIGIHNGMTYLSDPIEVQLSIENQSHQRVGSTRRRPGSKTGSRTDLRATTENDSHQTNRLEMRTSVVINDLYDEATCCVLFSLEYVLNVPLNLSVLNLKKGKNVFSNKTQYKTHHVTLRWSAWSPGNFSRLKDNSIELGLFGGSSFNINPDNFLVYKSPLAVDDLSSTFAPGKITFNFRHGQKIPIPASPKNPTKDLQPHHLPPPQPVKQTQSDSRVHSAQLSNKNDLRQVRSQTHINTINQQQSMVAAFQGNLELFPTQTIYSPVLALETGQIGGRTVSRAAYAKLHSSKFPPIFDRYGKLAEVIDEQTYLEFDLKKELDDPLTSNEIVIQFLAYSKLYQSSDRKTYAQQPQTLLFTFQFYRFPETRTPRLVLDTLIEDYSTHPNSVPFILRHFDNPSSSTKSKPGYMVKFKVDPSMLKYNEKKTFLQYLAHQTMFIDVWDGDSLHLIGTCTLQFKELLRYSREAVQATHELDVLSTEYDDDTSALSGNTLRQGVPYTANSHIKLEGRLHVRVGNIGYPYDQLETELNEINSTSLPLPVSRIIASKHATKIDSRGNLNSFNSFNLSKANHMTETFKDIHAALVTQNQTRSDSSSMDSQKRRKLSRMELVRRLEVSKTNDDAPFVINNHRKKIEERDRDLKIIEYYRNQTKRNQIMSKLNEYITTEYTLYPSFGCLEFFEYTLTNPSQNEQLVLILISNPDLKVVTDANEWLRLKQLNQMYSQIENNMFSHEEIDIGSGIKCPTILLRSNETLRIPFKYQSFNLNEDFKKIQVDFKQQSDGTLLSVLLLSLETQPHIVTQTFRFNQPENSILKKTIRLPSSLQPLPTSSTILDGSLKLTGTHESGLTQVYVKSSDSSIICESKAVTVGESHDIFIKAPCGLSPTIKQFHLAIYADSYLTVPLQIWQVYIHSLQRIDLSATQGQTSRFSLLLKGSIASRLARIYPSQPDEMSVNPTDAFMLESNSVLEINIGIRTLKAGSKNYYLNVVDIEKHEVINSWFIQANVKPPVLSKAFELALPAYHYGQTTNYHLKRITYRNPYSSEKQFQLSTNRSDLLVFKENKIHFASYETKTLSLKFLPSYEPGFVEIFVFINNDNDINEETFSLRVTYAFE